MQHILIVDDNVTRQAALCHILGDRGCGTVLALEQAQAQAVLSRRMAAAVILPLGMMATLGHAAKDVPLICLAQCDESGVGAVFALSPMVFAVMDPDTPPAVVADLVQAAMRDSPRTPQVVDRIEVPPPARRLTLA